MNWNLFWIFVALNTILYDDELESAYRQMLAVQNAGADAIIIQDMAILEMARNGLNGLREELRIPLHASTQCAIRTPEQAVFLESLGFSRLILERELSLEQIKAIRSAVSCELEFFVHGALCVCYSGQCYLSEKIAGRSANRGSCIQACRSRYDLVDASGKVLVKDKALLSLKDYNLRGRIEELADAGITSFKIEGRLKNESYVKNVVACYRQKLDAIFKRRKEYIRASSGSVKLAFRPQLDKSFTRGFTNYFLYERSKDIFSFDTPKSLGEEMGYVKEIRGNYIIVAGVKPFSNGDGICYLDERGKLKGLRINRVENNKLFPAGEMPRIKPRTVLYRNFDQEFEKLMQRKSAERKLGVVVRLEENKFGFTLTMTDEDDISISIALEREKELARTPQTENIKNQLGKLGNTPFEVERIDVDFTDNWFLPSSVLAEVRREAVEKLLAARRMNYRQEIVSMPKTDHAFPQSELTYLGNVMNEGAADFYRHHGVTKMAPAFEKRPAQDAVLMFCKHCLRYSMGWCPVRHKEKSPYKEPYYLVSTDGKRFRLEFDCKHCQMKVYPSKER